MQSCLRSPLNNRITIWYQEIEAKPFRSLVVDGRGCWLWLSVMVEGHRELQIAERELLQVRKIC
jgi:hypothetical protein